MKLSLMRFLHGTPGFRSMAGQIHPVWFFRLALCSVTMASWFWPHTKKLARPFREVLRGRFTDRELRVLSRRYLLYLRLFKELEIAWSNWKQRHQDWIMIDGECYLQKALEQGKGAILISSHNFGFSKFVAPELALRGYRVHRGGGGKKGNRRVSRWRDNNLMNWRYIDYKGDYWHRVRLLKTMQSALADNGVVHVSPRAYLHGEEDMAMEFFGRKYFQDSIWFRIFQMCRSPVLPCFAVASMNGRIRIVIHPSLSVTATTMAKEFAEIQSVYLTRYPEFGRLWKDVYLNRSKW